MKPRLAPARTLAIEHIEGSSPVTFQLTRLCDGKSLPQISIPSPYEGRVQGHPKPLMAELQWYLESFLEYPFPPEIAHAEHVLEALKCWGTNAFNALFDRRNAGTWLSSSDVLQIRSDSANILSWPWEALFDEQTGSFLAQQRRLERRLNHLADPLPLGELPNERVNVLLIVARPYQDDVRYRSVARPLIELVRKRNLPAEITVLRPPTFDNLRDHLQHKPNYYHVLHFDGHGAFGGSVGELSPRRFHAPEGCLIFESDKGDPDPKSAADLSNLLHDCAVPTVVLNACQSASLDEKAETPFSTVATALLQTGMRSVVAMAYSLYVSGAQQFLPAFYGRLFESGQVIEAVRAGRQQMLSNKNRMSPRGPFPLHDWLLPVLYQQAPQDLAFATSAQQKSQPSRLPTEVAEHVEEYGFIGRDNAILAMERALHRQTPCILIEGLGGVGKTTLARGFLRWLDETNGLDGALWFDFRDIRTSEYVINRIGEAFHGENFRVAPDKLGLLAQAFHRSRFIVVWDNFESASENLSSTDRSDLNRVLTTIHGTLGKVLITSRSAEEWLAPSRRIRLSLGGLDGEERWEFCETVLTELGLNAKVDRDDPELQNLLHQLAGHPLAMRVVLPKLERMDAAAIACALRNNITELGLNEDEEEGRLFATLRFVEQGLSEQLRPLLQLVGLHESYLNMDYLAAMAKHVDPEWNRTRIAQLAAALAGAGLIKDLGQAIYELHPLLTSYLRSQHPKVGEQIERAFIDVMARLADNLLPRAFHEQRPYVHWHGSNLRHALTLAGRLSLEAHILSLRQFLAIYARSSRHFSEASQLYRELAHYANRRGDLDREIIAYHDLGMVAQEERDFQAAREWYLKSLAISEQQGNQRGAASTYHHLGMVAQEERDFPAAREWYSKALAILEKLGNPYATYHQLGMVAQEERDFPAAREWYGKSLAISEKLPDRQAMGSTYRQLGTIAKELREFAAAQEWYLKSLTISEDGGDLREAAITYNQLGMNAYKMRDFPTARKCCLQSLALSEEQGNLQLAACTHDVLGAIALEERDVGMAREWYLKSAAISEKLSCFHQAAVTYQHLGDVAQDDRDFATARTWYLKSLATLEKLHDLQGSATIYHQLGMIAHKERDFVAAREWYKKSLAIREKQGDLNRVALSCGAIGLLEGETGNFEPCATALVRAVLLFRDTRDERHAIDTARAFALFYLAASEAEKTMMKATWEQAGLPN